MSETAEQIIKEAMGAIVSRLSALEAENARLREALRPFARVSVSDNYPDDNIVSIETHITREMLADWQADWDKRHEAGEDNMGMERPGPMNWPRETLAPDSVTVGHLRRAREALNPPAPRQET